MRASKIVFILLIVGLVVALPIANRNFFGTAAKEVDAAPVATRVISPSILASGFLAHEQEVLLSSEVIGRVAELFVEEGDAVRANDLVLRVDDRNLLASLEQSQAAVRLNEIDIERQQVRVENLQLQWDRANSLHNRGMIGDEEFQTVSNQLALARIDLKSAQERLLQSHAQLDQVNDQLSKTKIVSPIDGVVTSLDIKVGETAIASATNIPGSSLMTIANPDSIYTEVLVDEADVATIQVGQRAHIVAIAYPDQAMVGTVQFIANTAKVATGRQGLSFTVKIAITDPGDVVLRPGMSCRAEIFTRQDLDVPAVPIRAISFEENRSARRNEYFVFVNDNGIARKTQVEVGVSDDEYQEIISGVTAGTQILVGPDSVLRHLLDGDQIDVTLTQ
ncbi:efflux RND transporter periplasmic adaptor subunit [Gammaproteobacteria bacterium LSUCC0112]|nr:efflux RND transporter periplasmic adaptor subunit [Gammaproteobacteria bacterium LSUCC0112]